ncbi:MAG: ATP-binding protein [Treponema sp.]|uniref:ATP-binding protein n=1 Tax=Treponema sp. TaxID=166 RepID=UPI003FA2075B
MRTCAIKQSKGYIPAFHGKEVECVCEKHGVSRVMHLDGSTKPPECPVCMQEQEEKKKREKAEERRKKHLRKIGIRDKYFNESFITYKPQNEKAAQYLQDLLALAKNPRDIFVLMYGNSGTGKSHLASSAAILNNGIYTTWEFLDLRLRSTYNSYAAKKTEYQMMMYYCTIPFLVIDEIEKGKNEDAKMRCLSLICRERYERNRPLWLAGNCNYKWVKTVLDSSVIDRLKQKGKSFNFFWESYRPKLREAEAI